MTVGLQMPPHEQDSHCESRWQVTRIGVGEEQRSDPTSSSHDHRHDIHQILAYAALFDAPSVVAVLAYPMHAATWARLSTQGGSVTRAQLHAQGRSLSVALAASRFNSGAE